MTGNQIRNIWAVGRNYADHAKELGNEVPKAPLIFLKAGSTASFSAAEILLPAWAEEIHHETELALEFGPNLEISRACLALDLTERKIQNELKAKGSPWTLAKSFTGSCPLSDFFPVKSLDELGDLQLRLQVNGETRQDDRTSQMIFSCQKLVDYVRQHFPVCPGDLLLTGTPAGVGRLQSGDRLTGEIVGKTTHNWAVRKSDK